MLKGGRYAFDSDCWRTVKICKLVGSENLLLCDSHKDDN